MLKLKTKWFNKWAKKNYLSDKILIKTIDNISKNLGTVNLGLGLYKVRTPKIGQGKSGSFRTIVVFKKSHLAIFVYGFAKSEKDNLDNDELQYFKILAKDLLKISKQKYFDLEKIGTFIRIKE
jgi:hypothetical protein